MVGLAPGLGPLIGYPWSIAQTHDRVALGAPRSFCPCGDGRA